MLRGEVRLYTFKPPDKRRPVVILTRDGVIPHLSQVTVAAITSTIRGNRSEVLLSVEDGMQTACVVNLDPVQTVDKQRLGPVLVTLTPARLDQIRQAILFAWGFVPAVD